MSRKNKADDRAYNAKWLREQRAMPHKKFLYRAYDRKAGLRLKLEAIAVLGGSCIKCGFSDYRALEFDHIAGDGFLLRVNGKRNDTRATLRKHLRNGTIAQVYQLLCANCHSIKTHEQGEWNHNRDVKHIHINTAIIQPKLF